MLHNLPFSQNQPLKLADELEVYIRIFKNENKKLGRL